MEPILQSILSMRPMRDPELLTMQARSLEALAGFLAARPASVPPVLQKVMACRQRYVRCSCVLQHANQMSKRWHLALLCTCYK
jgi:hypothetical protein